MTVEDHATVMLEILVEVMVEIVNLHRQQHSHRCLVLLQTAPLLLPDFPVALLVDILVEIQAEQRHDIRMQMAGTVGKKECTMFVLVVACATDKNMGAEDKELVVAFRVQMDIDVEDSCDKVHLLQSEFGDENTGAKVLLPHNGMHAELPLSTHDGDEVIRRRQTTPKVRDRGAGGSHRWQCCWKKSNSVQ